MDHALILARLSALESRVFWLEGGLNLAQSLLKNILCSRNHLRWVRTIRWKRIEGELDVERLGWFGWVVLVKRPDRRLMVQRIDSHILYFERHSESPVVSQRDATDASRLGL